MRGGGLRDRGEGYPPCNGYTHNRGGNVAEEKPLELDAVCRRYGAALLQRCRQLCENRDDAEDLRQEVFARAVTAWPRYERRSGELAWLCGIMINCRKEQLARPRRPEVPLEEVAEMASGESETDWVLRLDLHAAVEALPVRLRRPLVLVLVNGFRYAEAARELGIPPGTVASRVYDAARDVRERVSADGSAEGRVSRRPRAHRARRRAARSPEKAACTPSG